MRHLLVAFLGSAAVAIAFWLRFGSESLFEQARTPATTSAERSPVCPWRDPLRDLSLLFPGATNFILETKALSGSIVPIRKRLGRDMTTDENPLRIFRVQQENQIVGSVLLARVKGSYGGIEIVVGVKTNTTVRGVLVQSQREPPQTAGAVTNTAWLDGFVGMSPGSRMRPGEDLANVPPGARASAQAIADGVRSQLIVLSFAEEMAAADPHAHH
jgi:hypothetical protein